MAVEEVEVGPITVGVSLFWREEYVLAKVLWDARPLDSTRCKKKQAGLLQLLLYCIDVPCESPMSNSGQQWADDDGYIGNFY